MRTVVPVFLTRMPLETHPQVVLVTGDLPVSLTPDLVKQLGDSGLRIYQMEDPQGGRVLIAQRTVEIPVSPLADTAEASDESNTPSDG